MYSNKLFSNKYPIPLLVIVGAVLTLGNPAMAQQADTEATAAATTTAAEEADAAVSMAEGEGAELDPGMQIPVDGSSLEAFNESLAKIKEQAEEPNYISLEEAIKYLLVYDLSAGRDRAKLAKNLDGLTGDQIIERVAWRKQ